jgi:hypothetical protein
MTEILFDICQRLGGYVWCSVVRDLILDRWQTIFSKHLALPQSFRNTLYMRTYIANNRLKCMISSISHENHTSHVYILDSFVIYIVFYI